jgi:hypothetical protein
MPQVSSDASYLADQLRRAFTAHDLDAFGALLSEEVRWGDPIHPRRCLNRSDVLATFGRLMAEGVDGTITELVTGGEGIPCGLDVKWPEGMQRPGDRTFFHVYLVTNGRIVEIQRHDDRASAAESAVLVEI